MKNLKYYMNLKYWIKIVPIKEGGWLASFPTLGEKYFRADGKTPAEALLNLNLIKKSLFEDLIAAKTSIFEPNDVDCRIFVDYCEESDILYITFGTLKPSYCDEIILDDEGILIEKAFKDNSLTGIRILDFKKDQ